MDDTLDKIRRNLVFVSAALILSKFLGVNFSGTNLPILGDTLSVIGEKDRIWWAVFFLLIYLTYRFISLKNTKEDINSFISEFKQKYKERKEQGFKNSVIRAMSGKRSLLCQAAIIEKIDAYNNDESIPITHQKKITAPILITRLSQTQPHTIIKKLLLNTNPGTASMLRLTLPLDTIKTVTLLILKKKYVYFLRLHIAQSYSYIQRQIKQWSLESQI